MVIASPPNHLLTSFELSFDYDDRTGKQKRGTGWKGEGKGEDIYCSEMQSEHVCMGLGRPFFHCTSVPSLMLSVSDSNVQIQIDCMMVILNYVRSFSVILITLTLIYRNPFQL